MIRLPGVLSIASKIAQEEGRVLETLLGQEASVIILPGLPGVLNIRSRKLYKKGWGGVVLEILCLERELL